jgi:general secretion pathway protein I
MHAGSRSGVARGFTLLEVLAALVIIGLGMLGVIEAIGQTASNSTRMRDRTLAHWVAMNRLTAVRLEPRAPNIAKSSDEVEMAGRRWRWTMEVAETPVKSMRRIDIRVAEVGDDRSLANVTGFYGSAIAAPGTLTAVWSAPTLPPGPGADGATPPPQDGGSPNNQNDNQNGNQDGQTPQEPPPSGEQPVDPPVNEPAQPE